MENIIGRCWIYDLSISNYLVILATAVYVSSSNLMLLYNSVLIIQCIGIELNLIFMDVMLNTKCSVVRF